MLGEKGQIFSVDFLISLVAVVAAIGLMLQAVEVNAYNQKEHRLQAEMKSVAETAAELIALGNDTTCRDSSGSKNFANCVDTTLSGNWQSKISGAYDPSTNPGGYHFEISLDTTVVSGPGPSWSDQDFYEIQRSVTTSVGGPQKTLKVKVWK